MIRLDILWAPVLFLAMFVLAAGCLWLFLRGSWRDQERQRPEHLAQCPYCGHVTVDDGPSDVRVCPLCKSYFEEDGR